MLHFVSVSSENKRDQRTIEQVLAESRAKKKLKTEHNTSAESTNTSVQSICNTDNSTSEPTV